MIKTLMEDKRFSELDLTRAGVISVQSTLTEAALHKISESWVSEFEIDRVHYRVTGTARHGRPSGADNDVMLAIQTLFIRHGCPNDNEVVFRASDLIALYAGTETGRHSGRYYTNQRDALLRLAGTSWTMVRSVWDEKSGKHAGDTITTHLFDVELPDFTRNENMPFESREINAQTRIHVTLSKRMAESIRQGFYLILDGGLLSRVGHPTARNLYRILQGHRIRKDDSLATELELPLLDWLKACGLDTTRPDNAKRLLDGAHQRLEQEGYLLSAKFKGRGLNGTVHYQFKPVFEPDLVERLVERKVIRSVAEDLASSYPQRIPLALRALDAKMQTGWRPRSIAASIVDAVRNPKKWDYIDPDTVSEKPKAARKPARAVEAETPLSDAAKVTMILNLLRVKLGRPASPMFTTELERLPSVSLDALQTALLQPKEKALELAVSIVGIPV